MRARAGSLACASVSAFA